MGELAGDNAPEADQREPQASADRNYWAAIGASRRSRGSGECVGRGFFTQTAELLVHYE